MPVSFDQLVLGRSYTRPELATIWGYASYEAISRGAVTPAGSPFVILFITKEKQSFFPQYRDELHGERLVIEGETGHTADDRIVGARAKGDEIHLFYRERHHQPFEYKGQIHLISYEVRTDAPSHFEFSLDPYSAAASGSLETELLTHGLEIESLIPEEEGRRTIRDHVSYERSVANRAGAIRIHGNRCLACGFSFDEAYGAEHAAGYIEIHHVRSIAAGPTVPDLSDDLIPLCSNCHSMVHRHRGEPLGLEQIRELVARAPGVPAARTRNE